MVNLISSLIMQHLLRAALSHSKSFTKSSLTLVLTTLACNTISLLVLKKKKKKFGKLLQNHVSISRENNFTNDKNNNNYIILNYNDSNHLTSFTFEI